MAPPNGGLMCTPSTFSSLALPGATINSITATLVQNYTASSPAFYNPNHGVIPPTQVDFCNVTVSHRHNGHEEAILTQVWLPATTWNGRLQATGGGGFIAGLYGYMFTAMEGAIAEGYTAVSTNAGIYNTKENGDDAHTWFLPPSGKVGMHTLEDFAFRSLGDMSIIGKEVTKLFYRKKPEYSYFSGCSNGGRQGYVLAQRYPNAFDGIAAAAPGIYWDQMPEWYWPTQLMYAENHTYPWPCELDALSKAAMDACDELDGVKDGVLQNPDACTFDPSPMVGKKVACSAAPGGFADISAVAAKIANGVWRNSRSLPGIDFQSLPGGYDVDMHAFANTKCSNTSCVADPQPLPINWLKIFVKKDLSWDVKNMTRQEYENLRKQSMKEYGSIMGFSSYDFTKFASAGGKMITYQGMSDPAVTYQNMRRFYNAVTKGDSDVQDYYRLFMAPGLGHGVGGKGAYPHSTFRALVDWVENNKAPNTLEATSALDEAGKVLNRVLCAYPKKSTYVGKGDTNDFKSWICV